MVARHYISFRPNGAGDYNAEFSNLDPYDDELVRSRDNMLHRTLSEIFRQRCLTRDQMTELLRAPEPADQDTCISKLILKLEPALSVIFPAENKFSLLWITVLLCYQRSAELLVRSGADVNERFGVTTPFYANFLNEETTILHCLLTMPPSSWNERFVGLVTEHGADLQARDSFGRTVLYCAAGNSRVEVARMLLEKGVDVNAADKNGGMTPLLIAARSSVDDERLILLLLDHGADVTARDAEGMNALHQYAAAFAECANGARLLIDKGASLDDKRHSDQYEPLYLAAQEGKADLVKLFLERSGADVNARRAEDGSFLLYVAARYVKEWPYSTMVALFELGANIDLKTNEGRTALHGACQELPGLNTIHVLLYYGADICAEDHEGNTPYSLMDTLDHSDACVQLMLRVLALKKTWLQPSSVLKEEQRIKNHPDRWKYYRGCVEEVRKMKSTRLIGSCTFFDLMTKCHCRTAEFMRYREFDSKLKQHKLTVVFPKYSEDIGHAIDSAERYYYRSMLKQESIIEEALYNILPHMIVRKVARYAIDCRDCSIKRIVNASRRSSSDNSKDNSNAPREQ